MFVVLCPSTLIYSRVSTIFKHSSANSKNIGSFMACSISLAGFDDLSRFSRYSLKCLFSSNAFISSLSDRCSSSAGETLSPSSDSADSVKKLPEMIFLYQQTNLTKSI